jgi:hypothetical protein
MMFVSSGQGPTFMADRDSHCSQLPSNHVGSSEYHDDSSQAMPHIFFASCTCSDLVYAALQAICTKVSKAPVMWLSFEEEAWGLQARQISNTMVYLIELPANRMPSYSIAILRARLQS